MDQALLWTSIPPWTLQVWIGTQPNKTESFIMRQTFHSVSYKYCTGDWKSFSKTVACNNPSLTWCSPKKKTSRCQAAPTPTTCQGNSSSSSSWRAGTFKLNSSWYGHGFNILQPVPNSKTWHNQSETQLDWKMVGDHLCVTTCGQQWDGIHRGRPQQPVQRHCQPNGTGRWCFTAVIKSPVSANLPHLLHHALVTIHDYLHGIHIYIYTYTYILD